MCGPCLWGGRFKWPAAGAPVVQQTTASAPQGLHGSAGFGLSLTQGNSDTLNISATADSTYDPKTGNAMKWSALFLRGAENATLSVNRPAAMFRHKHDLAIVTSVVAKY